MLNPAVLCLVAAALAGVAGTLLEMAWLRAASSALPGTVPAAALVVPAFLLAWTAGSALAGRLQDRAACRLLLAARWLAAGALAALVAPWFLGLLAPHGAASLGRRVLAGALPIVPAAVALGGALPLLARLRAAQGLAPARATGGVAAAVALGGLVGVLAFPATLAAGRSASLPAAGALALAGLVCLLLQWACGPAADADAMAPGADARRALAGGGAHRGATVAASGPGAAPPASPGLARTVLLAAAAFVAGVLLLAGQLLALRLLAQLRGDSLATTTMILAAVHGGMALGAALLSFRWSPVAPGTLGAVLFVVAGAGLLAAAAGPEVLGSRGPWLAALAMGLPLGLGAGSFVTAACRAGVRAPRRLGSWVGDLAAWSTLGGVAGALAYGALLERSAAPISGELVVLAARVALLAALVLALVDVARPLGAARARVARVLALAVLASAGWGTALAARTAPPSMPWRSDDGESALLGQLEGPHGVVSLVGTAGGQLRLKLDSRFGLGGSEGALLEQRLGRLAAALKPDAGRALLLGLGRGQTLAGLASATRAGVDCVERNAEILALDLEVPWLAGLVPRAGAPVVHHADARAWLAAHPDAYDLVVGDLFYPWIAGAGDLLTIEQFEEVADALAPGGVYVQWLPLHQLPWPAFAATVNAFLAVFPTARLFIASPLADLPLVALVGGLERGRLPADDAVDALLGGAPSAAGLNGVADVYDTYVSDAWTLGTRFRSNPANRRARPLSELLSLEQQDQEAALARWNMRQLAELVLPLDTSSLARVPAESGPHQLLHLELQRRGEALRWLLHARAATLLLAALPTPDRRAPAAGGPGLPVDLLAAEGREEQARRDAETRLGLALVEAWRAAPGHLGVRWAVVERVGRLSGAGRWEDAAALLEAIVTIQADGALGGLLGGVLVHLGMAPEAVPLLEQARELAPGDRGVLLNLGFALLVCGRDDEARATLLSAASASAPAPMPLAPAAALGLLLREPDAAAVARQVLALLDGEDPWALCLQRLLDEVG